MTIALFIISCCILFTFIGLLKGTNLLEKLMFINSMNNYIIVLLCFLSLLNGRESFLDIAYIYAFFGFTINLCLMKLFSERKND